MLFVKSNFNKSFNFFFFFWYFNYEWTLKQKANGEFKVLHLFYGFGKWSMLFQKLKDVGWKLITTIITFVNFNRQT
jgi:hypothetical protein